MPKQQGFSLEFGVWGLRFPDCGRIASDEKQAQIALQVMKKQAQIPARHAIGTNAQHALRLVLQWIKSLLQSMSCPCA